MMKQKRVFLSAVLTLVLLCSFILPVFAASYQNGDTAKVTVSSVWAFHAGRQPGKTVPPATVATGATITTIACIGSRAIPSTSCKWDGASMPRSTTAKRTFTAYTNGQTTAQATENSMWILPGMGT